jgi:hypothetical protein
VGRVGELGVREELPQGQPAAEAVREEFRQLQQLFGQVDGAAR